MKKTNIKLFIYAITILLGISPALKVDAQQKIMYYWDFDNFAGMSGAVSIKTSPIAPIHSNWSTLDSTKGLLSYVASSAVSSSFQTYWDVVAGEASDTFNVQKRGKSGTAAGNNELRFRNPSDSMEALISVPTTRYKNITIKYGLERTTSGQGSENFDYSTNGGVTWKTSGLSITHDTATPVFNLVTVSLATDTTVNNNASGFIFRIKFNAPNSTTSGNNRVDNITVSGDTDKIRPFGTPLYSISQVTPFNSTTGVADSLSNKTLATGYIKGVVMSPSFSTSYLQFSLADATGAITIYNSSIKYYTPNVGDSILVYGYLSQYHGVMEYDVDTIIKLTTGAKLETPTVLTAMTEPYLSQLIEIKNVHIITVAGVAGWATTGSSLTVDVSNGSDTFQLYITSATGIIGNTAPTGNFNVFGIESIYKSSSPYNSGYQLEPRFLADIQLISLFVPKPLYTIAEVTPFNSTTGVADSLSNKTLATGYIKGVVMSPSFSTSYLQFSLADATGAITIYNSSIKYYTPNVGDSILVYGYLSQYHGVMEYDVDTIIKLTTGAKLETPTVLTAMTEPYLSQLIEIKNVHIITVAGVAGWATTGSSLTVDVSNGSDTFQLYITSATGIIGNAAPTGNFNVFGIESIYKSSSPYNSGYQLEPRFIADIQLIAGPAIKPLYTIAQVTPFNSTTGVADSLANTTLAKGYLKGVVMSPSFSKSYLQFSLADGTGAITIYTSTIKYYTPNIGDSILVHGYLDQYNGVMEYTVDTIVKLTSGIWLETPTVLTAMSEPYLSQLIEIKKVRIVSGWTGSSPYTVNVTNGADTFQLYITTATGITVSEAPKGYFNVFGIESEYKSSSPYNSGYQLEPRFIADIQPIPVKTYTIAQVEPYNTTTGVADSIGTYCFLKGVVQSPNLSGSTLVEGFAVQDNTGGISVVAAAKFDGYFPNVGDSIIMRGFVVQSNGLTAFSIDSISKKTGGSTISPVVVTALGENTESKLVTMQTYALTTPSQWDTTKAVNGLITVQATQFNTSNNITMIIAKGTNLYKNSAAPTGHFDVTGIGSQDDPTGPFLTDYILIPRSTSDFVASSGFESRAANDMNISVFPNPASGFVNISASVTISKITVVDMMGNIVATAIPGSTLIKINTNDFSKGIYIVKVENGANTYVTRFVKN